jgi:general secretion pathway protein E
MAQRLVRLLCPQCRRAATPTPQEAELLGLDDRTASEAVLYHPQGCASCNHSGYRGRSALYELIDVDDELRALIHDGASEQKMTQQARLRAGSIQQDGRRRILAGDTSLQEVLRVTSVT